MNGTFLFKNFDIVIGDTIFVICGVIISPDEKITFTSWQFSFLGSSFICYKSRKLKIKTNLKLNI